MKDHKRPVEMKQKLLSLLCAILTALTVLTGAIAVPILCRPFYYAHVNAYHLTEYGWSQDEIYTAYNEMMDYCTGRREDFSAGAPPPLPQRAQRGGQRALG